MTNINIESIKDRFISLAIENARGYTKRSIKRILDAFPKGTDLNAAKERICQLYIESGEQFSDAYAQFFDKHLREQFSVKSKEQSSLLICFSGPFGAGKSTIKSTLDSGKASQQLLDLEAISFYCACQPLQFEFEWVWPYTGLYNPENHQGTFPYARAAGAGAKDAAIKLAATQGIDLLYPPSLTPHTSDGPETLQNELNSLQGYKEMGCRFVLIGCAASAETCLKRVADRHRKPPEAEILKSVEGFQQHFLVFADISDSCILLDTGLCDGNYSVIGQKTVADASFEVSDHLKFAQLMAIDLKNSTSVYKYLSDSLSQVDWDARVEAVRQGNGGMLPSFWNETIIASGLQSMICNDW